VAVAVPSVAVQPAPISPRIHQSPPGPFHGRRKELVRLGIGAPEHRLLAYSLPIVASLLLVPVAISFMGREIPPTRPRPYEPATWPGQISEPSFVTRGAAEGRVSGFGCVLDYAWGCVPGRTRPLHTERLCPTHASVCRRLLLLVGGTSARPGKAGADMTWTDCPAAPTSVWACRTGLFRRSVPVTRPCGLGVPKCVHPAGSCARHGLPTPGSLSDTPRVRVGCLQQAGSLSPMAWTVWQRRTSKCRTQVADAAHTLSTGHMQFLTHGGTWSLEGRHHGTSGHSLVPRWKPANCRRGGGRLPGQGPVTDVTAKGLFQKMAIEISIGDFSEGPLTRHCRHLLGPVGEPIRARSRPSWCAYP
jgi:hypothetical protein